MRQAGRYMAEYRKLRERYSLLEMFRSPELAAQVTLQPVNAFEVDAAILFADILLPLQGMGFDLVFTDGRGPVINNPIRQHAEAERMRVPEPEEDLSFILKSVELVRAELSGKLPLIGFAGAPFTLASYVIEGGNSRTYQRTKLMMYAAPETWRLIMGKIADVIASFLVAQIKMGAQAVQVFDSWAGCLSPHDYKTFVLPYSKRVFEVLAASSVPSIHFALGSSGLLPLLRDAGGSVISVDWRISLNDAWSCVGDGVALQGNLDPTALLAPWEILQSKAEGILDQAGGRAGHIFNLGHGILPSTQESSVRALTEYVHEYSGSAQPD
jgi:uroporphyrinogen decarboxylase